MLVLELLVEIGDKIRNGDKIISVKGEKSTGFDLRRNALVLRINTEKDTHFHTCEELLDFIKENNITAFDKVLIDDNGYIQPAETFLMWDDEFIID